jgi:hypothetical protein
MPEDALAAERRILDIITRDTNTAIAAISQGK